MAKPNPTARAKEMLRNLNKDRDETLLRLDAYMRGIQDDPYMPENADEEYELLAARSITNICPFIVKTPVQAMYVDSFRRGGEAKVEKGKPVQPEWEHFQRSGLDARQAPIYEGALTFGHSFVLTEKTKKGVRSKGLSALKTTALFEDPANDNDPLWALTITKMPKGEKDPGKARMWDSKSEYEVTFESFEDVGNDKANITVKKLPTPHGATECPVTRFAAWIDLEGRTSGVIEPMIQLQNRLNQTVFDLLIVQSYASFKVRTISGMAPPMKMKPIYETVDGEQEIVGWEPELDKQGRPIPSDVNLNAKRFLFAEDDDTKFDTLDETPLDGFISAINLAFRHMAALSQTPPHHILGEIANLSAEALTAAETALSRRIAGFQAAFGECWERVFRIAAQLDGNDASADDFAGEVIWRDMEQRSLAQSADALGKFGDQLEVPKRGLWELIPGVTATQLAHWDELRKEEDQALRLSTARTRASGDLRPTFRTPSQSQPTEPVVTAA